MNKQSDVDYVYPKKGGSPDVPGALGDTEGWLIEDPSDHPLKYWSGGHRYGSAWTDNASKAVRFSRREDAEAVIKNTLDERWIACGHEWISTHAPDWKNRAERAEADIEKLKMDAEHLQYERDEAREGAKAEAGEPMPVDFFDDLNRLLMDAEQFAALQERAIDLRHSLHRWTRPAPAANTEGLRDRECETCSGSGVMSVLDHVETPNEKEVYVDAECGECHGTGVGWIGEWIDRALKAEAALAALRASPSAPSEGVRA